MAKIAILFPAFLGGGAEAVCLWMVQALKDRHEVTLVTLSEPAVEDWNRYYGTSLRESDFECVVPRVPDLADKYLRTSYSAFSLRQHFLVRYFKRNNSSYDLAISAFNEMDLDMRGIQYIHLPMFAKGSAALRTIAGYPDSPLRRIYHAACRRFSEFSDSSMRGNLSIANSEYCAVLLRRSLDLESIVVFPPVRSFDVDAPWEERKRHFICLGRLLPEKRVIEAVDIIGRVRAGGAKDDVEIHIAGSAVDPNYFKKLTRVGSEHEWVNIYPNPTRQDIGELLSICKYGIHMREHEMFGIAVGEMVVAGVIPFVPLQGGAAEVVGVADLTFSDPAQAVERITWLIQDEERSESIRRDLAQRRSALSESTFMARISGIVEDVLWRES